MVGTFPMWRAPSIAYRSGVIDTSIGGRMGIVGCPILEDEIVYLLDRDRELGDIFVVEDEHSQSLLRKLRLLRPDLLTVKEAEVTELPNSEGRSCLVWMKSFGLHEDPKKLAKEVVIAAKLIDEQCSVILLAYGLCGNAFKDMNLLFEEVRSPVVILTDEKGQIVDDCIAAPLGGTDGYLRLLKRYAGVFYMTPAWAEHWPDLINKMDFTKGTEGGDLETLKMLFEIAGYNRVLRIDTGIGDRDIFHEKVREFSKEFNFIEVDLEPGFVSTKVVEDAYHKCLGLMKDGKGMKGEKVDQWASAILS